MLDFFNLIQSNISISAFISIFSFIWFSYTELSLVTVQLWVSFTRTIMKNLYHFWNKDYFCLQNKTFLILAPQNILHRYSEGNNILTC